MSRILNKLSMKQYVPALLFVLFGLFTVWRCDAASAKVVNLSGSQYGYGEYTLTARGTSQDGVISESSVTFDYLPVIGEIVNDGGGEGDGDGDGIIELDLEYDYDDGSETGLDDVVLIEIIVTDEDGNRIDDIPPIYITPPDTDVQIDLGQYDLEDGVYQLVIITYGDDETTPLDSPFIIKFEYKDSDVIVVPDTGSITKTLSGTKSDYLITGLMIFAILAFSGIFIIVRNDKKATAARGSNKRMRVVASRKTTNRKKK